MAQEFLVPNADDGGWAGGGSWSDLTNGTDTPDGVFIEPVNIDDVLVLEFGNTSLTDGDTIIEVQILVRGWTVGLGTDRLNCELFIDGVGQGIPTAFWTLPTIGVQLRQFSLAAWNQDWSQAQLNGAQVHLVALQQGMPVTVGHQIDEVDFRITTLAAGSVLPGFKNTVKFKHILTR